MQAQNTMHNGIAPLNGIDLDALSTVMRHIERDPAKGVVEFRVTSQWQRQTRSRTKDHKWRAPRFPMLSSHTTACYFSSVKEWRPHALRQLRLRKSGGSEVL